MSALPLPGATAVRIAGDHYQWLNVWEGCVRAYKESRAGVPGAVAEVGVEVDAAGNLDDLVLYRAGGGPSLYTQVKYAVDASTAVGEEYLFKASDAGGPSILRKIAEAWQTITAGGTEAELALVSNRYPDPDDDLLKDRDARTGLLMPRAAQGGPKSARGKARARWAANANLDEPQLQQLLNVLSFRLGRDASELRERVSLLMEAAGLRFDDPAIGAGIHWVAEQVISGQRMLTLPAIGEAVGKLRLQHDRNHTEHASHPAVAVPPHSAEHLGSFVAEVDPFALEVHRAVAAPKDSEPHSSQLPLYVPRAHDEILKRAIGEAISGKSALFTLIGSSSTGKTRAFPRLGGSGTRSPPPGLRHYWTDWT